MSAIHLGIHPFEPHTREQAREIIQQRITHHNIISDTWIGIVAELHPVKGLLYAVDAIALLREKYPALRLVIIGEGDQRDTILKQIEKRRLQEKVFLVGFMDDAKTLIKAFDVCMLPSLSEAFGYTLVEAGYCEVPVIATSVGGIPEVIDEAGILVPSKNSRALAEACDTVLSSKTTRNKLSSALHQRVTEVFSVEKMVEQTLDIYCNKA